MLFVRNKKRLKKKKRISKKIMGTPERPRLVVFRSLNNIYGQIVDDVKGHTLVSASSLEKDFKKEGNKFSISEGVGNFLGEKAVKKGIKEVVFDRNGYLYHGRVKAFADGVRKKGLIF